MFNDLEINYIVLFVLYLTYSQKNHLVFINIDTSLYVYFLAIVYFLK